MIAYLRGRLFEKDPAQIILDVNGVGYALVVSTTSYEGLGPVGSEVRLHVHTHATQDAGMQLFGFLSRDEKDLFETLLSVQGVGPKLALAVISGMPGDELRRAIAAADVARLTQIRGVGRKTAERIAVELRDKVAPFPVAPATSPALGKKAAPAPARPGALADLEGALLGLGYRPAELEPLWERFDPETPVADLLKQALAALRKV